MVQAIVEGFAFAAFGFLDWLDSANTHQHDLCSCFSTSEAASIKDLPNTVHGFTHSQNDRVASSGIINFML